MTLHRKAMELKLGSSDLYITPVGYGAWAIGGLGWQFGLGSRDDNDSIAAIHSACRRVASH